MRPPGLGPRPRGSLPPHLMRLPPPSIRLNLQNQSQAVSVSAVVDVSGDPISTTISNPKLTLNTSKPETLPLLASKLNCDRSGDTKDDTINVSDSQPKTLVIFASVYL